MRTDFHSPDSSKAPGSFTSLVELLERRADEDPSRPLHTFLLDGEEDTATFTIGALRDRARAIAVALRERGAQGERALLLHAPGLDYIAAFFGCLYAGVIAVPAYPPDPLRPHRTVPRLQAILRDAGASLALTTAPMLDLAAGLIDAAPDLKALHWLATDTLPETLGSTWRAPKIGRDDLAFLQYTSGSTSTPKGVELTHANLLYNLEQMRHVCAVTPGSVLVSWLPPYHDMGLIAFILEPLYSRCRGVLMSPLAFLERPLRWLQAISRYRGTACGTPSFGLELCVRRIDEEKRSGLDLSSLRTIACGGEPIRADTVQRFLDAFAVCGLRRDTFQPLYGLAEATLFVSGARETPRLAIKKVDRWALERDRVIETLEHHPTSATLVGCGHPYGSDRVLIVDPESKTRRRAEQVGEIWISSPSVARGYWRRPEITRETFQARLADTGEGPFLRTGDLGFLDGDDLYITGRLKDLILLNGTNHYAEDIEHTVQGSHPALRRGCGAAFSIDEGGQERVVVVQEIDPRKSTDAEALISDIRQALSLHHQISAHDIVLLHPGTIPKTSSGKIQRHACRAEYLANQLSRIDAAPPAEAQSSPAPKPSRLTANVVEAQLLEEVAAELGQDPRRLDPTIALTRYGPDSLALYGLAHRVETKLGLRLDVDTLLDGPTIRQLAQRLVAEGRPAQPALVIPGTGQTADNGLHPLSHGQEAMWFLHQLAPAASAYHLAQAARIVGAFSPEALRNALRQLVARHSMLRTTFTNEVGRPRALIHDHLEPDWVEHDSRGWTLSQVEEALHREAYRPFDLERGPLLRLVLFRGAPSGDFLAISLHHIIADLWSLAILARELGELYTAACTGGTADLPPLAYRYADYVAWRESSLAGEEGERLFQRLRRRLSGRPPQFELPTDRPRPPLQTFRGATFTHRLEPDLTGRLRKLGETRDATLHMTLLAAFQVLLHRHGAGDEIWIGSPSAGRSRPQWAGVVGYFVNPVIVNADLSAATTFTDVLDMTRRSAIEALATADLPFPLFVERLHPVRDPSRSPLFQVMFCLHNTASLDVPEIAAFAVGERAVPIHLGALRLESFPLRPPSAQLDLSLVLAEVEGALCASWQYNSDLFDEPTVARLAEHFEILLQAIAREPAATLSSLPVFSPEERRRLLVEWNDTARAYNRPHCIHQLFEEQARRTPDAVALRQGGATMTYAELELRSNRLAHHLARLGVGPEVPVAICVDRSFEMMVGLLGILKAGGAYLPLDPSHPRERLAFVLDDAEPPVLLTHGALLEHLPSYAGAVVHLEADWERIETEPEEPVLSGVIGNNLAYILYTSGSTGRPKGVMNSHAAVCNYLLWLQDAFPLRTKDHLLQITPLSFDISVTECFWPLASGARLTLAEPEGQRDAAYLLRLIREHGISILQAVPSTLRMLLEQTDAGALDLLRLVLCGGESLPLDLTQRFFAASRADLYNVYGPTEASVWATYWKCQAGGDGGVVPIGKPLSNVVVRVLDPHLNLVPVGVPGELHIGGAGLARGYLNRPALTAERFIEDPFASETGGRLYKTGDLARYRPDGNLEFLGRLDHQVKIHGHRIELGEIEAVLTEHMAVRECAVVARTDGRGEPALVAYIVSRWEDPPDGAELRRFLKDMLPEYMLPGQFVSLPALPLSTNGKLDRAALPEPDDEPQRRGRELVIPRNREEFRLCELWERALGLSTVGIHDDFFELGGDSLRAAELAAHVSVATAKPVSVRFILQHRTVAAAAEALKSIAATSPVDAPISLPAPPNVPLPASSEEDEALPSGRSTPQTSGNRVLEEDRRSDRVEPSFDEARATRTVPALDSPASSTPEAWRNTAPNLDRRAGSSAAPAHARTLPRLATPPKRREADAAAQDRGRIGHLGEGDGPPTVGTALRTARLPTPGGHRARPYKSAPEDTRIARGESDRLESRGPMSMEAREADVAALDTGFRRQDDPRKECVPEKTDTLAPREDEPGQSSLSASITAGPESDHLVVEHRPFLSLLATGRMLPVQAAAIAYFPSALLADGGVSRDRVVREWCDGMPLFCGVHETPAGRIGTILLPLFSDDLYTDKAALLDSLREALVLANSIGASTVSLTGLLPSATAYGRDLRAILGDRTSPRITTGHATTAATVVLAIEKILCSSGRDIGEETVAFLGLGSIGVATLTAMLHLLPHPRELLLCDLSHRREALSRLADSLGETYGYPGRVRVLESREHAPREIYEASLIVGATNFPEVLEIERVRPGTLVVDDSAPHCFRVSRAIERLSIDKDILFTEGGILRAARPFQQYRYLPAGADANLLRTFDVTDTREITGCIYSSLLSANHPSLPPTIGDVEPTSVARHYETLRSLGFEAGSLRCAGMVIPQRLIDAFRAQFGAY